MINENDTVATSEIRYGDNDRLAARVATMASADLLILLSDVDGLYTAPPGEDPEARLIPIVPRVTAEIEAMAGGAASQYSRGGMRTKIEAADIATTGGAHMVIADGREASPLSRIAAGGRCTWFLTPSNPMTARKKWIAGSLEPKGALHVDEGAARALGSGKSLLPAGVSRVEAALRAATASSFATRKAVKLAEASSPTTPWTQRELLDAPRGILKGCWASRGRMKLSIATIWRSAASERAAPPTRH